MMKPYDPQKAARVWQRVQGTQPEPPAPPKGQELPGLILGEMTAAQSYLQLARQLGANQGAALQRLAREEQNHAACLKGICHLITGEFPAVKVPPVPREPPERALRRCYGQKMRSLAEYEARREDPEYGPVFARLAEQEREHCRVLLELLGQLGSRQKR